MVDISEERQHCFIKKDIRVGDLLNILQGLWMCRQKIKKEMKCCDKKQYLLSDARQFAIKLCMNSLFGLTGVINE